MRGARPRVSRNVNRVHVRFDIRIAGYQFLSDGAEGRGWESNPLRGAVNGSPNSIVIAEPSRAGAASASGRCPHSLEETAMRNKWSLPVAGFLWALSTVALSQTPATPEKAPAAAPPATGAASSAPQRDLNADAMKGMSSSRSSMSAEDQKKRAAEKAEKQAQRAQKKADDAQKKADAAKNKAGGEKQAQRAQKQADDAQKKADAAKKKAEAAQQTAAAAKK